MNIFEKFDELKKQNVDLKCNSNISNFITENDIENMHKNLKEKIEEILKILLIDYENDHNTKETARRVAKMLIYEAFRGRYYSLPKITDFPNALNYDELYVTGPISVKSFCAHHFLPIYGSCFIGIYPASLENNGTVLGLSKFNKIVDWFSRRPQIQEELTVQIADKIEKITKAKGVAVVIRATHMCITHRGDNEHSNIMTTSVMRGEFRNNDSLKQEFFNILSKY